LGEQPDFPPFYSLRASMSGNDTDRERDLYKAISLAPTEWRYNHQLTNYYNEKKEYAKALQIIKPFHATHRNHFPTASLYMRTLTYNNQYAEAEKILNTIHILPFEGESAGRLIYREIKMILTAQALAKGNVKEAVQKVAEAQEWPHRLGVGKPYDDMIDSRLEDWMKAMIAIKLKNFVDKELNLKKVTQSTHQVNNLSTLLQCVAYWQLGEQQKANDLFDQWSSLNKNSALREWGEGFYKNNRDKAYPFDLGEMTRIIGIISENRDSRLF